MAKRKNTFQQIISFKLVKIEKRYNPTSIQHFYELILEGNEEPLFIVTPEIINIDLTGEKISYKLNEDGLISSFELL